MKRLFLSLVAIACLVVATGAFAAPEGATTARLVRVTSPVARNAHATLVADVVPRRLCRVAVYYKAGASHWEELGAKFPVRGRVSWTWLIGRNWQLGRWPIRVTCFGAGSFRTHFTVVR